jgi:rubrerythrin
MLVGMMRPPGAVRWICRLCDTGICRGSPGGCPVGNAARDRYAEAR